MRSLLPSCLFLLAVCFSGSALAQSESEQHPNESDPDEAANSELVEKEAELARADSHPNESGKKKEKKASSLKDPQDGMFDMSGFLDEVYGFVPVPSLITEPALGGIGGMLGLAFFGHRKDDERIPPNIFFVGGGYTANKTWMTGAGYKGFLDKGRLRVTAWGFYGQPNIELYAETERLGEVSALTESEAYGGGTRVMRKVGELPLFLGASLGDTQFHLTVTDVDFGQAVDLPDLETRQNHFQANASGEFDTRNNYFSPTAGTYLRLDGGYNMVRGDQPTNFGNIYGAAHQFFDLKHIVLGFRAVSNGLIGDAPFYLRPYVSLRGVPTARYQGDFAFAIETEEMVRFTPRIGMVAFGGWGKALSPEANFKESANAWSVGAGFRYLIARLYGLQMGVDIARGPETFAWYVQFGHAWNSD